MSKSVCGLALAVLCLGLSACDESPPPAEVVRRAAPADPVGHWRIDLDALVDENWEAVLARSQPAIDAVRQERARIAALPATERTAAERAFDERVAQRSREEREMVAAVVGGTAALKAWVRSRLAANLGPTSMEFEFRAGGACSATLQAGGSAAEGTWTQRGSEVTVRLTSMEGKPAKGADARPVAMTLADDRIRFQLRPGTPRIVMRRSDG